MSAIATPRIRDRNLTPERVDVAWRGLELRADVDRLLATRRAVLGIEWIGKWAKLCVGIGGQFEVIARSSRKHGLQAAPCSHAAGAVLDGLQGLMRIHHATIALGFDAGMAKLQFQFPQVPGDLGITLVECRKDHAARYVPAALDRQAA